MALSDKDKYYQELAEKWLKGKITPEEEQRFSAWYNQHQDEPLEIPASIAKNEQEHHDRILGNIRMQLERPLNVKGNRKIFYAIAASFALVLLSISVYYYMADTSVEKALVKTVETDIQPGGNKAILTLADGSVLSLNDLNEGGVIKQQGIEIIKSADGVLTYRAIPDKEREHALRFNTISTPKGGQYQIILPDGTKVWLNSASSLRYPTSFYGDERKVELSGEGYFEVAKNRSMPFKVKTDSQEITVLGTHFNVKAYHDEPQTKTTLLEGSVGIYFTAASSGKKELVLKPGEQSSVSRDNEVKVVKVDIAKEVAWKSGIFSFQGSDIQSVMRELSRWYNVDVEFEGTLPPIKLWGEMDRNVTASEALEILRYFNLKYKILQVGEEKKIIIS